MYVKGQSGETGNEEAGRMAKMEVEMGWRIVVITNHAGVGYISGEMPL